MDAQKQIKELENRVNAIEKQLAGEMLAEQSARSLKSIAPKELLLKYPKLKTHQKTLLLAYYYESEISNSSFNVDDISNLFRLAKEKAPTNINDMINKNIAKGYIMEDSSKKDGKKAWSLTATGETYIKNELGKEVTDD